MIIMNYRTNVRFWEGGKKELTTKGHDENDLEEVTIMARSQKGSCVGRGKKEELITKGTKRHNENDLEEVTTKASPQKDLGQAGGNGKCNEGVMHALFHAEHERGGQRRL